MISEAKLKKYYRRALAVAQDSHDQETQVGSILIHSESGAVIADGYNGFVRGADDDKLPKTRPEKYDFMVHSEVNLICNSVRHGISTQNCFVFCTMSPCISCMRILWQAGIKTIYVKELYKDFQKCLSMGDLKFHVTNIGEFVKIEIRPDK